LYEIWSTLRILLGAGPGRFWALSVHTDSLRGSRIFSQVNNARFHRFSRRPRRWETLSSSLYCNVSPDTLQLV